MSWTGTAAWEIFGIIGPLLDKTKHTTETAPTPPNGPRSKRTEMTAPHELNELMNSQWFDRTNRQKIESCHHERAPRWPEVRHG